MNPMILIYVFAAILVYFTYSLYYGLYGKGQEFCLSKLKKKERIPALPFLFKASLFMSLGLILLIIDIHIIPILRSKLIFILLAGLSALLTLVGLFFSLKYARLVSKLEKDHKNKV